MQKILTVTNVAAIAILALALPVLAADEVAGKWEASVETPRGTNDIVMEFTGSADALEGTITGPQGTSELEDVAYADGTLTFKRTLSRQGNSFTLDYSATVDGDTMNVTISTPRGERTFTARRAA